MTTVNWIEAASADLAAAEVYATRRSVAYARGLVARILNQTDALAQFPRSGVIVPEFADDAVRELYEHPYRIVYRVCADRVDVVAVVHAARRMPRGF